MVAATKRTAIMTEPAAIPVGVGLTMVMMKTTAAPAIVLARATDRPKITPEVWRAGNS
jgi:hypothetical protein